MKTGNNILSTKNLALTGLFAAVIFLVTYFIKIPFGFAEGYGHLGDTFIYLAAVFLPTPLACSAAALGAALADGLSPYIIYIIPSIIIKTLTVVFFTHKSNKIICKRNILAFIPSVFLCAGGYFIFESIIYNPASALVSMPLNAIQAVVSFLLFFLISIYFDKTNFKNKI